MPRSHYNDPFGPAINFIIVIFSLIPLVGLMIWTAVPLWIIGLIAISIFLPFCALLIRCMQPDFETEMHFLPEDRKVSPPELHNLAEAARKTT